VIIIINNGLDQFRAALYIRLSRDDGDKEESNSVTNQKSMLIKYVEEHNDLLLYEIYIDDGYTGTNFERPSFKRMIRNIQEKKIGCVIVKDLSRFGRDYIETGNYIERYFVDFNIRFIAINDNIDSLYTQYDMLLPIKNIFNEQYALDISKKVQTAFKVKQKEGQFIGAFPSYGYIRDPLNKHNLIIDESAATIVRRIFSMYANGIGKLSIAKLLNAEGILCPSEYKNETGMNYRNSNRLNTTNYWTYSTINHILKNEMYRGNMVQGKTKRRMKGKAHYLPQEQWIIVKKNHPPIITEELWEEVQRNLKRDTRYIDFNQKVSIFAGFLKCGDCGRALAKNINLGKVHYICGSYKNYGKGRCSSHRINQTVLEDILLEDLNNILSNINIEELVVTEVEKKINMLNTVPVKKEIEKIEIEIQRILFYKKKAYQDYLEELINKEEFIEFKKTCESKIILLNDKKALLKQKNEKILDKELPLWIKSLLETKTVDKLDRSIVMEMIDVIYIYEDKKIKIVYNYE